MMFQVIGKRSSFVFSHEANGDGIYQGFCNTHSSDNNCLLPLGGTLSLPVCKPLVHTPLIRFFTPQGFYTNEESGILYLFFSI